MLLRLLGSALAALLLLGCGNFGFNVIRGSGTVKTETREASGFHAVTLAGLGDLAITQGDSEGLTIEAEDNLLPYITTEVNNGRLAIGIKSGTSNISLAPTKPIKYNLQVKTLDSIGLSGAGNITTPSLTGDKLDLNTSGAGNMSLAKIQVKQLTTSMSGAGNATLDGQADGQDVSLSGLGNYSAGNLQSKTASVTVSGAGSATVWVGQTLTVRISGAGAVSYYGSPQVQQTISGVGSVKSLGPK
jgi:hypothetical protein